MSLLVSPNNWEMRSAFFFSLSIYGGDKDLGYFTFVLYFLNLDYDALTPS